MAVAFLFPKFMKNWKEKSELQTTSKTAVNCTTSPSVSEKKGDVRWMAISLPAFCPGWNVRYLSLSYVFINPEKHEYISSYPK